MTRTPGKCRCGADIICETWEWDHYPTCPMNDGPLGRDIGAAPGPSWVLLFWGFWAGAGVLATLITISRSCS